MKAFEALDAAYNTCILVRSNSANVLASEDSPVDQKWFDDADKFIRWYDAKRKLKGDWKEKLQKSMDALLGTIEKL